MDVVNCLWQIPPFNVLDGAVLHELAGHVEIRDYAAGDYIFRQGDASLQCLFVVISGSVEINIMDDQDREVVTALRQASDFLGETAFFSDEAYIASAKVAENAKVIVLPFGVFDSILSQYGEFTSHISKILAGRIRTIYHGQMIGQHSGYSVDQPAHKRVADLMSAPAVTCLPHDGVTDLARLMTSKSVTSVIVMDEGNHPMGIITEKDLVRKVVAAGGHALTFRADQVMSQNLYTINAEAFYFEAMLMMVGHGIKHLAVVADDRLAGMITIRDMVQSRGATALNVVKSIEQQDSISGLASAALQTDKVLQGLVAEDAGCRDILQLMTELFDRLTRKVLRICEEEMVAEGHGAPPVPYSWFSVGSSGRQEQFMKTDQDNGIIYDNPPTGREEETAAYFLALGKKASQGLLACGFALCPGGIMASNPAWCRSLDSWVKTVTEWTEKLNPDNVRAMTVFPDFRHIHGDKLLAERLRQHLAERMQKSAAVLHFMAQDDLSHRVPLNFFKQVFTEKSGNKKGQVDLKASASVHLVDGVRILSLRDGVLSTNTFLRLRDLGTRNILSGEDEESYITAYDTLLAFRIRRRLMQLVNGEPQNDYINPEQLTKREKAALREAFIAVDRLQSIISHTWSQS
jgi:CBS domain-containing protein